MAQTPANKSLMTGLAILVVVGLLVFLIYTANAKASVVNSEKFYEGPTAPAQSPSVAAVANQGINVDAASSGVGSFAANDPDAGTIFNSVGDGASASGAPGPSCFPRDRLNADDLLPKDAASSKWAQMNPAGQGDVADVNFLAAGYHVGLNTTGGLRNRNLTVRADPVIPVQPVSPWLISTIVPENRRGVELGA